MPLSLDDFYLEDPPTYLQQGDILAGTPVVFPPHTREFVVIRSSHHRRPFADRHLPPGLVELLNEGAITDAFEEDYEYVGVAAARVHAMVFTPTCDLADSKVLLWSAWPLHPVDGSGIDPGNLAAGKYANLYRIPDHSYFEPSFLDFTDIRTVASGSIGLKDRVASITRAAQDELNGKFARCFGRTWGHAAGEEVPKAAKHETGKFRCAGCILHEIEIVEMSFKAGDRFPECPNCEKIGRPSQWYPVRKHRRY